MAKYGKGKVACVPINPSLTLESKSVMLGSVKNDSVSNLSIEKKGKKIA